MLRRPLAQGRSASPSCSLLTSSDSSSSVTFCSFPRSINHATSTCAAALRANGNCKLGLSDLGFSSADAINKYSYSGEYFLAHTRPLIDSYGIVELFSHTHAFYRLFSRRDVLLGLGIWNPVLFETLYFHCLDLFVGCGVTWNWNSPNVCHSSILARYCGLSRALEAQ